jgi:anaerobic selenocysteine-containing dehydrogenase
MSEGGAVTDRIKKPWGERTPFGPGETWPVRVDQFLEEGVSEAEIDRWVQTASILHSNGDALDIAVKDGRIVGVRGRGVDRINRGRVDPKDLFGWQANNSGDRLKEPLVRQNGELIETSWDEAMGRIIERSKELLEEKGPLAFGFYTTGELFLEEYYTLNMIGKAGLGTPRMDGNTRLCTATAAEALKQTFGTDGQPGSYADVDHADAIVLYGHNVAETQAVLWMRTLDRLEGPQPPKLVVVDPRTKTARAPQLQSAASDAWVELSLADAGSLGVGERDVVRLEAPRGRLEAKARISGIKEDMVFAPFHYGYFDQREGGGPDGHPWAANELTITERDPASKQPLYKVGAVRVTKVADAGGTPAPAPTTTASAPAFDGQVPETAGGRDAEAAEYLGKE